MNRDEPSQVRTMKDGTQIKMIYFRHEGCLHRGRGFCIARDVCIRLEFVGSFVRNPAVPESQVSNDHLITVRSGLERNESDRSEPHCIGIHFD